MDCSGEIVCFKTIIPIFMKLCCFLFRQAMNPAMFFKQPMITIIISVSVIDVNFLPGSLLKGMKEILVLSFRHPSLPHSEQEESLQISHKKESLGKLSSELICLL